MKAIVGSALLFLPSLVAGAPMVAPAATKDKARWGPTELEEICVDEICHRFGR